MQIFSILLKLKGYDEKLGELGKITTNPILHTAEDFCLCFNKIIKKLN